MSMDASASLGEVLRLERRPIVVGADGVYREIGIYSHGRGIFHKAPRSGVEVGDKDLYLVKHGDFILQITFAWEGAVGLASEAEDGMYGSVRFPTFRVNEVLCYPPYLLNYFRTESGRSQLSRISPGSAGRNRVLSLKRIPEIKVPLPPLDEQRRIVARIEALARKVEAARVLRRQAEAELAALRSSVLVAVLPSDVELTKLGQLIEPGTSISYGVLVPGPDVDGGVPFVRVQDLDVEHPPGLPGKRIDGAIDQQYRRTRLRGGEVLVGVVGSIGKVGIAPDSWAGANIARAVCRIVPSERLSARYLAAVFQSPRVQEYFQQATRTLAQPTLNIGQLEETMVPVPSIDEQHHIVSFLREAHARIDDLTRLQRESAGELVALLPSILDKAFKGEL